VIPEAVIQTGLRVQANDQIITTAAYMGNLELNAFLPVIADALLESTTGLTQAAYILNNLCIAGIQVNTKVCQYQTSRSIATATALATKVGYHMAECIFREACASNQSMREIVIKKGCMTAEEYDALTAPEMVTRLGSS
jgi:aspartate ammonia-lyase